MDVQDRLEVKMEPSTYKASGILAKELEDELMKFTKKDEDCKVDGHIVQNTEEVQSNTDMEVNITECTKSLGYEQFTSECQDTTESSSSFEHCSSGAENGYCMDNSEASPEFCDDAASADDLVGFNDKFRMRRKKKVSTQWRSYVEPVLWRCKWVELQMKRFQIQSQKYDRELKAYNEQKKIRLENNTLEDGVRSLPYSQDSARTDILKRKKRKMTEATTDMAAYMSSHNLFSYYENRKSSSESTAKSNETKIPVRAANQKVKVSTDNELFANDELFRGPGDGDSSLEHLLCKIYHLQSHVGKLKDRVNKVLNENAGKFPCTDDYTFTMPCNSSPSNNGERVGVGTYIASQLLSEYNMGDNLVPESAVTSHGEAPNNNGHVEDGALIDNQRVKDEMNSFTDVKISALCKDGTIKKSEREKVHSIPTPSPLELKAEPSDAAPSVVTAPDLPTGNQSPPPPEKVQSIAKLNATKGKRRRARKGGARWSRRSTG